MPLRKDRNNPWYFKVYKGEVKKIPFVIKSGPKPHEVSDITGYSFIVRGRLSMDTDNPDFELDNSSFVIDNATGGLAYFIIPEDVLSSLNNKNYLCQITTLNGGEKKKSQIFTISILQSV